MDLFKISSLGYNYAAIWTYEKNGDFLKELKFEMGIFKKKEAESLKLVLARPSL